MMPETTTLFLSKTIKKLRELHSTYWTQSLSLGSIQAHMRATGSAQLHNPFFKVQSMVMM